MAISDALERRVGDLRGQESARQEAKRAALREAFSAEKVSLEHLRVSGRTDVIEVAVLDSLYLVVEMSEERPHRFCHRTGPGQGEYAPGSRTILGTEASRGGSPSLVGLSIQDVDEMAAAMVLHGERFTQWTSSLDAVLAVAGSDSSWWYNNM